MIFSIDERDRAQRIALIDAASGISWTYGQLTDELSLRASGLRHAGKSLLFLFCGNDLPSVAWYLAAVEAGSAVALLSDRISPDVAANLIALYRPEHVLASFPIDNEAYQQTSTGMWERRRKGDVPLHPDLTLLLSTSGTTGSPRFVRLTRRNFETNAESICEALSISGADVPVAHLPIHYSYGLSVINSHLLKGASIVLTRDGLVTPAFWDAIRRYRVDSFSGVPYNYQMLRRLGLKALNVPSLRIMTQAGGKLDSGNIAHFNELTSQRGGGLFVMYGQTEASPRISTLHSADLPGKPGSVGRVIRGGSLRIQDLNGALVSEPDIEGELVYEGPNVMLGYAASREDLTRGDELGGRLRTGDRARIDSGGFLFILGRSGRDAKLFGLRVNLDDIEAMVRCHGPAAAVAGTDRITIFCEFGTQEMLSQILCDLAAKLRIHRTAFEFRRVGRLPAKDTGKIDYAALNEGI